MGHHDFMKLGKVLHSPDTKHTIINGRGMLVWGTGAARVGEIYFGNLCWTRYTTKDGGVYFYFIHYAHAVL